MTKTDEDGEENDTGEDEVDSLREGVYRPWSTYICSCQENCSKFRLALNLHWPVIFHSVQSNVGI